MEFVYTGNTAVSFYRTPPRIIKQLPPIPGEFSHQELSVIQRDNRIKAFAEFPISLLISDKNEFTHSKQLNKVLWSGKLPARAIWEDENIGKVTSPLFTLFMLSREMSTIKLAMLMYEFCGRYALVTLTDKGKEVMNDVESYSRFSNWDGWERVVDSDTWKTMQWMRKPLIEIDELKLFAQKMKGYRGCRNFAAAADIVNGVTYSPFETKAAILLSAPRKVGGQGFCIETNKVIRYTSAASKIARRGHAEADIYIESPDGKNKVVIECQGRAAHIGGERAELDADRALALESMGYHVVFLSYKQIENKQNFDELLALLASEYGIKGNKKSERQKALEEDLRYELFSEE